MGINRGEDVGKVAVIVDVVDQNRALVSCPQTGVSRKMVNFKCMSITDFVIEKLPHSIRDGPLSKAIDKSEVLTKWEETPWAKKLASRARRAQLNDFERFQVKVHTQTRNRIIRKEFRK